MNMQEKIAFNLDKFAIFYEFWKLMKIFGLNGNNMEIKWQMKLNKTWNVQSLGS